ncbi:arginine--tRNA ligase [Patescibacteria group bacterium]
MLRDEIKNLIERAVKELQEEGVFPDFEIPEIEISHPDKKDYGDYSTNTAFKIAKDTKKNPLEIGGILCKKITELYPKYFNIKKVGEFDSECVAGFINFSISKKYLQLQVEEILKQKNKFGKLKIGKGQKVNLEFISANPTGPLTLGNGRGGFCGDVLANILEKADFKVEREYYVNDTGKQVEKLGHSVLGDEEAVYKGDYIEKLKKRVKKNKAERVGEESAEIILKEIIIPSVKKMRINFDTWFSEKNLHKKGKVKKVIEVLKNKKLAYEKEKALWFKATSFGDDKDRVLIKADGETTYLSSDIAYMKDKFDRGANSLIFIWGADHFGYIERIKAAAGALGYDKEKIEIIIMQLVKLFSKGKEVKMSKRTGDYITLDELIDEVGLDVARFFFLTRSNNSHLDFDMDLAKEQSEKNPVYYVQYAYARICSILKKASKKGKGNLKLLESPAELVLLKQLVKFPEVIEDTVKDYQTQRVPQYAIEVATAFHWFYRNCRVITEDKKLADARISLISAAQIIIKNTLDLMGVSTPEKM